MTLALPVIPVGSLHDTPVADISDDVVETVGWPAFVRTVANVYERLPAKEREIGGHLHRELRRGRGDRSLRSGLRAASRVFGTQCVRTLRRSGRRCRPGDPGGVRDTHYGLRRLPCSGGGRQRRRPRERGAGWDGLRLRAAEEAVERDLGLAPPSRRLVARHACSDDGALAPAPPIRYRWYDPSGLRPRARRRAGRDGSDPLGSPRARSQKFGRAVRVRPRLDPRARRHRVGSDSTPVVLASARALRRCSLDLGRLRDRQLLRQ